MAYTKDILFSKIGELVRSINDSYSAIAKEQDDVDANALLMLEADVKYLATHIEVYQRLHAAPADASPKPAQPPVAKETPKAEPAVFFTPPTIRKEQPADSEERKVEENKSVETEPKPTEQNSDALDNHDNTFQPNVAADINPHRGDDIDKTEVEEVPSDAAKAEEKELEPKQEPPVQNNDFLRFEHTPKGENTFRKEEPAAAEPVAAEAEEPKEEVLQEEAVEETVVNEVVVEEKQVLIPQVEETNAEIEAEPEVKRPLTLNEMLSQQKKANNPYAAPEATTNRPAEKPMVTDLKAIISLNDKLLFIKDLFNGYSLAYSEAIELLNRYPSFAEADAFLQTNYALKNNWADKSQTVEKLYAVLRKKYM